MALHILPELEQGTDEWHDQRRGIVTASVVGQLISVSPPTAYDFKCPACGAKSGDPCISKVKRAGQEGAPIKTAHPERNEYATKHADDMPPHITPAIGDDAIGLTDILAAERVSGNTDPTYMTNDMWRGVEDEPRARDLYAEKFAPVEQVGFMVRDDWGFKIGYSPDGLVGDDGLIEVKSRKQKKHFRTVLNDKIPAENMAQIQTGLLVSGRKWCDYISYCGGMHMWPKRVFPDQQWFDAIVQAVALFEDNAADAIDKYLKAVDGLPPTERPIELEMVI